MKIAQYELTKALVRDLGNLNGLHDVTSEISRIKPMPDLLTSMIQPESVYLQTKVFEHDVTVRKHSLPQDKQYNERGDVIDSRPVTDTHLLSVPSYGFQAHVRAADVLRRRKRGTNNELLTKEDVIAEEKASILRAWELFRERSLAHIITTGTNFVPKGTVASTDFYQEYTGQARPTVTYTLSSPTTHPKTFGEQAKRRVLDNLNDGERVEGFMMLCGATFWQNLTNHPMWIQAMVNRTGLEGQDPLIKRFENFRAQYQMVKFADEIVYVEAGGFIGGAALIPANEAYLIPIGVNLFTEYFAPAETETYINTVAEEAYMWESSNEFDGTKLFSESNRILVPHNPLLIQKCVAA